MNADRRRIIVRIGRKEYKDFRIAFKVTKTLQSTPNTAEVTISNLSEETRSQIESSNKILTLRAGYADEGGAEVLFIGDVSRFVTEYQPPNIDFVMSCGDGEKKLATTLVSLSFAENASALSVLNSLASKLGTVVRIPIPIVDSVLVNGFSFYGQARIGLTKICDRLKVSWSIQNQEIVILASKSIDSTIQILMNKDTGMIASPEKVEDKKNKGKAGWKVKSLLNPKIQPGGQMQIKSRTANGTFKILSVDYTGDNWGNDFMCETEVISV